MSDSMPPFKPAPLCPLCGESFLATQDADDVDRHLLAEHSPADLARTCRHLAYEIAHQRVLLDEARRRPSIEEQQRRLANLMAALPKAPSEQQIRRDEVEAYVAAAWPRFITAPELEKRFGCAVREHLRRLWRSGKFERDDSSVPYGYRVKRRERVVIIEDEDERAA
jgi:hypothetical protein